MTHNGHHICCIDRSWCYFCTIIIIWNFTKVWSEMKKWRDNYYKIIRNMSVKKYDTFIHGDSPNAAFTTRINFIKKITTQRRRRRSSGVRRTRLTALPSFKEAHTYVWLACIIILAEYASYQHIHVWDWRVWHPS